MPNTCRDPQNQAAFADAVRHRLGLPAEDSWTNVERADNVLRVVCVAQGVLRPDENATFDDTDEVLTMCVDDECFVLGEDGTVEPI